jgi:hypothetical protein
VLFREQQVAVDGADDACRHGVLVAQRVADGDHRLAGHQVRTSAQGQGLQTGGIDLQDGHVVLSVGRHDLGVELAAVGKGHGAVGRAGHHVRVGHDVALGVDHEPAAHAGVLVLPGPGTTAAVEELVEWVTDLDDLGGRDVDDGVAGRFEHLHHRRAPAGPITGLGLGPSGRKTGQNRRRQKPTCDPHGQTPKGP